MVGSEFLDFAKKFELTRYVGVEDFADKLNFLFTVVIFLMCTTIISVKQYLMKPLACFIPNVPSGSDFDDYLENYCWTHGTIPLRDSEHTPQDKQWDELDQTRRITYYQWVPFVMGLQCIMFYTPRILWQVFCYNRTGTDLEHIITTANTAVHASGDDRKRTVEHISHTLEDMFFQHRDFREGRLANLRRSAYTYFSFCMISKRLGTWLVVTYLIVKLLYLTNAVGQLYLMKSFLGFNSSIAYFGWEVLQEIRSGRDWRDTQWFPRVAFCNANNVRQVGAKLRFTAQCALPVNMLNEKLYIFLWFWVFMVAVATALSIPLWFLRISMHKNRFRFIKKYLRVSECYANSVYEKGQLKNFINCFLRHDGVFLLRMIAINAGDLVTTEIVTSLWEIFQKRFKDFDLRNYPKNCSAPLMNASGKIPLPDSKKAEFRKYKPPLDPNESDFV